MAVYKTFIKKAVHNALTQFTLRDTYLLENDVSERAMTHKIAEYLQIEFGSFYSVDCEYNRNHVTPGSKQIYVLKDELADIVKGKSALEIINDVTYRELSVYPDIIVHKRGRDLNLLVIEVKKSNSRSFDRDWDFKKLEAYTDTSVNNLHYEYGLFINLDMTSFTSHDLIWFKDGRRVGNF
ncbi:hypothetical protein [Paenibacillus chitinolyticus]|uniref:hypothetical protein n=1 Tax=Paenibacillus chitinolyticus TaxID=79263 RepID=UPI003556054E